LIIRANTHTSVIFNVRYFIIFIASMCDIYIDIIFIFKQVSELVQPKKTKNTNYSLIVILIVKNYKGPILVPTRPTIITYVLHTFWYFSKIIIIVMKNGSHLYRYVHLYYFTDKTRQHLVKLGFTS